MSESDALIMSDSDRSRTILIGDSSNGCPCSLHLAFLEFCSKSALVFRSGIR